MIQTKYSTIIVSRNDSYAVLKSLKEELEYRNVHLLSAIESERQTKWKLEEFAEEQRNQLESLRREVCSIKLKNFLMLNRRRDKIIYFHYFKFALNIKRNFIITTLFPPGLLH